MDNLLFFAQLLEEMLFDYTIDSYKAPVFNTHALCAELLDVLSEIETGFLQPKAANPILEELTWDLKNDFVAKEILGLRYPKVIERLNSYKVVKGASPQTSSKSISSKDEDSEVNIPIKKVLSEIETLNQIFNVYYLDEVKKNLLTHTAEGNGKKEIEFLARVFISELQSLGYTQQYLFHETRRFFFSNEPIESVSQLNGFLSLFSGKRKEWEVLFRVDEQFKNLDQTKLGTECEILDEVPISPQMTQYESKFIRTRRKNQIFIKFKNIKALDPFQARLIAERFFFLISNLVTYKTHKEQLLWESRGLAYSEGGRAIPVAPPTVSPMMKIRDTGLKELQNTMDEMASLFINTDGTSSYLIYNSLNLHACSVQSKTAENQLMNIWTAMETLLPPPTDQRQRILQFADAFEPLLGRKYIQKLVNDLLRSLYLNVSENDLNEIFSKMPSNYSKFEKCALLVALKEKNEPLRDELYAKIGRNPLLINRIYSLMEKMSSASKIHETIVLHNQRVRWQLQRIYRARNLITHKGEQISYVSPLLENAHSYYHSVIDLVKEIRENYGYTFHSLESVFNLVKIEHEAHLAMLKENKGTACSEDKFKKFLFGV
ncbi:hypothetical protein SZ63_05600 [Methanoculleus sediminis]|uniref:Apea-like HEPN domain-containing protein n=1 Tax=Methanoculleus sediminis TaxID=1550566 RepID=A0A0H1R0A4_9EURY|nr:hypothetical protein [Methanoculleus sediminis]KLK88489.1 hypothetical protein SZ63_05600 [Methanoculleus sediminis]